MRLLATKTKQAPGDFFSCRISVPLPNERDRVFGDVSKLNSRSGFVSQLAKSKPGVSEIFRDRLTQSLGEYGVFGRKWHGWYGWHGWRRPGDTRPGRCGLDKMQVEERAEMLETHTTDRVRQEHFSCLHSVDEEQQVASGRIDTERSILELSNTKGRFLPNHGAVIAAGLLSRSGALFSSLDATEKIISKPSPILVLPPPLSSGPLHQAVLIMGILRDFELIRGVNFVTVQWHGSPKFTISVLSTQSEPDALERAAAALEDESSRPGFAHDELLSCVKEIRNRASALRVAES